MALQRSWFLVGAAWPAVLLAAAAMAADQPIALCPDNPHYLLFRGKPAVLVGSTEHYGAVLNPDFDAVKYLNTLKADGLNLTRTFSGAYCEPQGAFHIARNTLAPAAGRLLAPWARSDTPGYANGGNKFDLARFSQPYFARLKDFVAQAGRRGIVVELVLFCPMYDDSQWKLSPMNAANNVNGVGGVRRTDVYTLEASGGLLAVQERLVRKIVAELRDCDNLYYEICNEPYFGGVSDAWQERIAGVLLDAEKELPARHLIARNIANKSARVDRPYPGVSILNFHYAVPEAVAGNYRLGRVVADDETGFNGAVDAPYLVEAWNFLMSGGAVFDNLDYSFAVGKEDGTFAYPASQPGAGSPVLRAHLAILKRFLESFDLPRLRPDESAKGGLVLAEPGRQYAVYRAGGGIVELAAPAGQYQAQWWNIHTGSVERTETIRHPGGAMRLSLGDAQAVRMVVRGPAAGPAQPKSPAAGAGP
jgi:hypothetical protein